MRAVQRRVHTARARGVSFGTTPEPPGAPEPRPPSAPEPRPPSAPGRALCSLRREPKLPPDDYTRGPLFSRASWVRTLAIAAAIPAGWRCLCRILGSTSFVAVVRRLGAGHSRLPTRLCPVGGCRREQRAGRCLERLARDESAAARVWHARPAKRRGTMERCGLLCFSCPYLFMVLRGRRSDARGHGAAGDAAAARSMLRRGDAAAGMCDPSQIPGCFSCPCLFMVRRCGVKVCGGMCGSSIDRDLLMRRRN